jgi:hypothetical protein
MWYNFWFKVRALCFRWVVDSEGDIGLMVVGCVIFLKYKDSTLVYFGNRGRFVDAPKYVRKRGTLDADTVQRVRAAGHGC